MPVIGILTCVILELEFAHLLKTDKDIASITVLENAHACGLISSLEAQAVDVRRIPHLRGMYADDPNGLHVVIRVLELALHNRKRLLQEGLVKAAKEMGRHADAIFLGYGLCGNALQNPTELLADAGVPVFIPMDEDHAVDDCVGLCIGGRKIYYEEQCRTAGTFFMIPGWTCHWKEIFEKEHGRFDLEFAKRLFKMSGYERSLVIPTPVLTEAEMRRNVEEFNHLFGFRTDVKPGTLDMLRQAWEQAKRCLTHDH